MVQADKRREIRGPGDSRSCPNRKEDSFDIGGH